MSFYVSSQHLAIYIVLTFNLLSYLLPNSCEPDLTCSCLNLHNNGERLRYRQLQTVIQKLLNLYHNIEVFLKLSLPDISDLTMRQRLLIIIISYICLIFLFAFQKYSKFQSRLLLLLGASKNECTVERKKIYCFIFF